MSDPFVEVIGTGDFEPVSPTESVEWMLYSFYLSKTTFENYKEVLRKNPQVIIEEDDEKVKISLRALSIVEIFLLGCQCGTQLPKYLKATKI